MRSVSESEKKTLVTNIWNKSSAERFEGGGQ